MKKTQTLLPRPPIVVIMGHVDHGKTSLLDYIRKTGVVAKEAGGITQSIGAYEIIHASHESRIDAEQTQNNAEFPRGSALSPRSSAPAGGRKITFIDTPGHEAFSKMRARGAKVSDLAILVVAADDGVKPQTKESIEILNAAKTPFIVAINKIDKPSADIEKTKQDLTANGILLEGFGGNISWQAISAKTGQGINELLDLILLAAELENLTYDSNVPASGIIIETKINPNRGIVASVIIENGILKTGEKIFTASAVGKIKNLTNFLGKTIDELSPSSPAIILGFETLPQIGEEFFTGSQIDANLSPITQISNSAVKLVRENSKIILNLVIKADTSGSLETLSEIIKNIKHEGVKINILNESIGEITDGDIKTAIAGKALIIGFGTKVNKIAENLAKIQEIKIIISNIIYELIEAVENEVKLLEKPKPLGEFEVLKIFSRKNKEQLVGGRALSGVIKNNSRFEIIKNNEKAGFGKVVSLRQHKREISQISANEECGLFIESDTIISEGDRLIWK